MVRALMRKKDCMENELFSDFSLQASFFSMPARMKKDCADYFVFFLFFYPLGTGKNAYEQKSEMLKILRII